MIAGGTNTGTFFDDFERADGAPGGNWSNQYGTSLIAGGTLHTASGIAVCRNTTVSDNNRLECTMRLTHSGTNDDSSGPVVKHGSSLTGYALLLRYYQSHWYAQIYTGANLFGTQLASSAALSTPLPYYTLKLIWNQGHLSGYYNGTLVVEVDDSTYQTNTYCAAAFYNNSSACLDFQAIGGAAPLFSVSPTNIPNYGGAASTVYFTGSNTTWTPGTPGSPTFTCDHGTLSAQTVDTSTTAHATYSPGTYLGTVVFTDPSTGATATALVTSDTTVVPPTYGGPFTPQAVAMVNNTAGDSYLEKLTKPNSPVDVDAYANLDLFTILGNISLQTGATVNPASYATNGALYALWQILNGNQDAPIGPFLTPPSLPVAHMLANVLTLLSLAKTGGSYDVGTLMREIAGYPGGNIQNVLDAIAAQSVEVDLSPVLDLLQEMRGDTTTSLYTLLTVLGQIRTVSSYTLGSVKTWIDAIPTAPSLTPVLDKLDAIQPSSGNSIDSILTKVISSTAMQTLLNAAVLVIAGEEGATISAVLTGIQDLSDLLSARTDLPQPPAWPGEDKVTLGTEVSLSDGLILEGPMDGALVTITAHPKGAGSYPVGEHTAWLHVGAVAFQSDHGEFERTQALGLDAMILTPASIVRPVAVVVRLNNGWEGTIQPWTVNEPSG